MSHAGWPAITGIFWMVTGDHDASQTGSHLTDELLGHHGSDRIEGGAGRDVIWGDWDPMGNTTRQRDTLLGGAGADRIYPSHGTTTVRAGAGNDDVWAYYGKGVIDCGPGDDLARVRRQRQALLRSCERVRHFCAFGSKPDGGCYEPGEKPRRQDLGVLARNLAEHDQAYGVFERRP